MLPIAEFIKDCGLHANTDIETLREIIKQHLDYNTLVTLYDDKGLYAVTRFNTDGKVAVIIDSCVRKDRRCKQVLVDMIKEGIIDPVKVARTALQNAASAAAMLLTTEVAVAEIPKEKPVNPPMGGMDY